jgi:hypothetical protein
VTSNPYRSEEVQDFFIPYVSKPQKMQDFLFRSQRFPSFASFSRFTRFSPLVIDSFARYTPLTLNCPDPPSSYSQSPVSKSSDLLTSPQAPQSLPSRHSLLLIDGLPLFPDRSAEAAFLSSLFAFAASFATPASASVANSAIGIVIILTTSQVSQSADMLLTKLKQRSDLTKIIKFFLFFREIRLWFFSVPPTFCFVLQV